MRNLVKTLRDSEREDGRWDHVSHGWVMVVGVLSWWGEGAVVLERMDCHGRRVGKG